tara:strand:+ start:381 stop:509 length:129 start_codon:yes stop_codon:yes gene_type:complete
MLINVVVYKLDTFFVIFGIYFEMLQEKTRFKLRIIGGNYENF